jgi:hypothetical protein
MPVKGLPVALDIGWRRCAHIESRLMPFPEEAAGLT